MKNKGFYGSPVVPRQVNTVTSPTSAALVSPTAQLPFYAHFQPTEACYIVFGSSTVGEPSAANGVRLAANVDKMFQITKNTKYFRVVRVTNDGVLRWYIPGETS